MGDPQMSAGGIFSLLVIALLSYTLIGALVRRHGNRDLNAWVQNQTVIYDGAVLVRQCIHLVGRDETAEVGLALSPLSDFEDVWAALRRAGTVATTTTP